MSDQRANSAQLVVILTHLGSQVSCLHHRAEEASNVTLRMQISLHALRLRRCSMLKILKRVS
eukprot:747684-Amphidinium_carterae.2